MTKKNTLLVSFLNESITVKHNDKILSDSDVLERIQQIIGQVEKITV